MSSKLEQRAGLEDEKTRPLVFRQNFHVPEGLKPFRIVPDIKDEELGVIKNIKDLQLAVRLRYLRVLEDYLAYFENIFMTKMSCEGVEKRAFELFREQLSEKLEELRELILAHGLISVSELDDLLKIVLKTDDNIEIKSLVGLLDAFSDLAIKISEELTNYKDRILKFRKEVEDAVFEIQKIQKIPRKDRTEKDNEMLKRNRTQKDKSQPKLERTEKIRDELLSKVEAFLSCDLDDLEKLSDAADDVISFMRKHHLMKSEEVRRFYNSEVDLDKMFSFYLKFIREAPRASSSNKNVYFKFACLIAVFLAAQAVVLMFRFHSCSDEEVESEEKVSYVDDKGVKWTRGESKTFTIDPKKGGSVQFENAATGDPKLDRLTAENLVTNYITSTLKVNDSAPFAADVIPKNDRKLGKKILRVKVGKVYANCFLSDYKERIDKSRPYKYTFQDGREKVVLRNHVTRTADIVIFFNDRTSLSKRIEAKAMYEELYSDFPLTK